MRVPGHNGIQQNETADWLARENVKIRPTGPEPFLLVPLSRFKFKIRNLVGKRKQLEWRICGRYETSQLRL